MQIRNPKYRKRPYKVPADKTCLSAALREVSDKIRRGNFAGGLAQAEQLLGRAGLSRHDQARVLGLVGDSEFKRGAYDKAVGIYQQAATLCLDHHELWVRPLVGQVRACLKAVRVDDAVMMARHAYEVAKHKVAAFDELVGAANIEVTEHGSVTVPPLPPRVSVVATRMGYLFLQEGEPEAAGEFFRKALVASPRGACRARQGLAQIALAMDDPATAFKLATQALCIGNHAAKTIPAWPILIAARRKLGGWQISQNLVDGLAKAPASVRARAVLVIVHALRNNDMRQWRKIADQWMKREGQTFPIVTAEICKLLLSSAKITPGNPVEIRQQAEALLRMPGLSFSEYLAAAKQVVQAGLADGVASHRK